MYCNVCIDFLNSQVWKEIMLELNGKPSKCYHVLNWVFVPKPGFLEFIWIFKQQKSLKNQYLPHSESKSYQINSIKSCSSRSFQQHWRHIPIPPKFSATIYFNFPWRHHSIFKNFCTTSPNIMEPSPCTPHRELSKAFQRHQEHNLKHPGSVDLIITKQNKTNYLPS
jgi:hypothetical protein